MELNYSSTPEILDMKKQLIMLLLIALGLSVIFFINQKKSISESEEEKSVII